MEQLYHRSLTLDDTELKNKHLQAFEDGGYILRSLVLSIIKDPNYQQSNQDQVRKMITPHLFASQLEGLTSFRYQSENIDAFNSDLYGLRSMSGGIGEDYAQQIFQNPSPTFALVVERIGQAAAYHVTHDPTAANLFFSFDFQLSNKNTDEHFDTLFRKVISRSPSAEELQVMHDLWSEIYTLEQSNVLAWQILVGFLFRHPHFLLY
jgi:hypothetical protein